jgi:hypothetical protein
MPHEAFCTVCGLGISLGGLSMDDGEDDYLIQLSKEWMESVSMKTKW